MTTKTIVLFFILMFCIYSYAQAECDCEGNCWEEIKPKPILTGVKAL